MFMGLDLANLVLFCAQQFGIAAGTGAQLVMMLAYFQAMQDGLVDAKEAQFLRATRRVSFFALSIVIVSGLCITALHLTVGDAVVVLSPAYLFKWILIGAVLGLTVYAGAVPKNRYEAVLSGSWLALFLVHTLAPVASWGSLLLLWAVWMAGFVLCWYAAGYFAHPHAHEDTTVPGVPAHIEIQAPLLAPKHTAKVRQEPAKQITIMPDTLSIKPTEIPMPAAKTTDTPFLPKVPPLQPLAPDVPLQPRQGELPKPPVDALGINVMPKSPDQVQK